jgi:hypothetical protein
MKPSTRMHEVYDLKFKLIRFCGSRTAANAFWAKQAPQARQDLVVRVSGR